MSLLPLFIGAIYACAISFGIWGALRFLRYVPAYLVHLESKSKSIFHFRYAGYVAWMHDTGIPKNNGALFFGAGLAVALFAFPFLLII